ncbi:MAG: hypothetical protein HRU69_14175 [Flammeovirgaceae bacterium]|nr:MAG: hypothetical protein HRU69_14175 [Flammeovirgaceae bacterium]
MAGLIAAEQHRIALTLDSLESIKNPDTLLLSRYSAFQMKLDSLKAEIETGGMLNEIERKVSHAEDIANSKFDALNDKVNRITQGKVNLQGEVDVNYASSVPSLNVPGLPVSDVNSPLSNTNLQNSIPSDVNVSKPEIPGTRLPKLEVNELGKKTQYLDGLIGQVRQYKEELEKVKDQEFDVNKISNEIERQIIELDAVKAFEKEIGLNPFAKSWNDPEVMKEMAFNKGKEQAMNHFAGHEQELMAAMEQFSKIRAQMKNPEGTIDMLKKQNNPMKDKKFVERLVPGLALQLQKPGPFWFDLNPSLGYKLSGKFTLHAGWNYRWAYANDEGWLKSERIYGPRTMLEYTWRQYFSFVGIAEVMSSPLKLFGNPSNPEYTSRDWIWSYMVGTKTSYNITKSIKGNAQVLYNLYDPDHQSPYGDRLNVRMGVEYVIKLKKNATEGSADY